MRGKYDLSEGALQIIMRGGEYPDAIMQVLGSKKINSGNSEKERYRILLSDGKHTISFAMLTTQTNDGSGVPETFSVISIDKFITSVINNTGKGETRVLLILDMHIIAPGSEVGEKLGSPTPLTDMAANDNTAASTSTSRITNGSSSTNKTVTNGTGYGSGVANVSNIGDLNTSHIHPISSLSPYHNKWVIKARVTNKTNVRSWSNSRGEGKLFSVDLVDESGEIRLTGFRDAVEKFYDFIQVDKIYYISKCQLKPANKQFSTLKNDYEMTMNSDTIFQECHDNDDSKIPQVKYDFISIDKIASIEPNALVDVVGVVKSVGELQSFQARSTGRELKKKDIMIVDQSQKAISLTLWGADAESFEASGNPVIVLKGARVTEFGGGKSLSTLNSTTIKINPEIPECYRMRSWYDNEGESIEPTNLSAKSGIGSMNTPWMNFKEVQEQNLGNGDRGDYYQVMATILLLRSENAWYKACPTPECNKKVIDLENGMYRCEKCNREFPNFKYRLLASMNVGDYSGNQWVSMFSSEAERVLGMTSEEVGRQIEENSEAMVQIADKVHFKQFIMKCRAKMETYNDEARLKTVCIKVDPIEFEEYNTHLIERIEQFIS